MVDLQEGSSSIETNYKPRARLSIHSLCQRKADGTQYALKCLRDRDESKREVDCPAAQLIVQVSMMWFCRESKNIVHLVDVYENLIQRPNEFVPVKRYLLVMELMKGGELFDRISQRKSFTEAEASKIVRMMAAAIAFLHKNDIAHRDLKPENFLYRDKSEGADLCLSDFGFAKFDEGNLSTPLYTPYYVAGEVLKAQRVSQMKKAGILPASHTFHYDKSCDMWSMGVIIYILLCGYPPFQSEAGPSLSQRMQKQIMEGDYVFHDKYWGHISAEAKEVVRSLLCTDSTQRMTAKQLVEHPWVTGVRAKPIVLGTPAAIMESTEQRQQQARELEQVLMEMRRPVVALQPLTENPLHQKRLRMAAQAAAAPAAAPAPTEASSAGVPASTPALAAAAAPAVAPAATPMDMAPPEPRPASDAAGSA